jgi:hypothetical protein
MPLQESIDSTQCKATGRLYLTKEMASLNLIL